MFVVLLILLFFLIRKQNLHSYIYLNGLVGWFQSNLMINIEKQFPYLKLSICLLYLLMIKLLTRIKKRISFFFVYLKLNSRKKSRCLVLLLPQTKPKKNNVLLSNISQAYLSMINLNQELLIFLFFIILKISN